jgi:hypothetical protein
VWRGREGVESRKQSRAEQNKLRTADCQRQRQISCQVEFEKKSGLVSGTVCRLSVSVLELEL